MKSPQSITLLTGLAALLSGCAPAAEEPAAAGSEEMAATREAAVAAIDQVREREIGALTAGRLDDMVSVYAADVAYMPPNAPLLTGREAAMEWAAATAEAYEIDAEYTGSAVTVAGDWAIERYAGSFTFTPKAGGAPITDTMKGIHVYQRQPDGSWLIAQDIWNADGPPGVE